MRLKDLQATVQDYLLAGVDLPAALADAVAPPASVRWAIYAEGYRLRLIEALAGTYPVLATRLGADEFDALATDFVLAHPSVHRSIRDYGGELAGVLAAAAQDAEGALRAELAAFEWRLAAAFDAEEAVAATPADMANVPPDAWGELRFAGVPSLGRLATTTNAVAVWQSLNRESDGTAVDARATAAVTEPQAALGPRTEWLVVRRALTTEFRSLEADEAAALDTLVGGATFGELCEDLYARAGDAAAARAASWLKGWLEGALLVRRAQRATAPQP